MRTTSSAYAERADRQPPRDPELGPSVEPLTEDYAEVALGVDALYDLGRAAIAAMGNKALARVFNNPIYRILALRGPMPDHIVHFPQDLRPGRVRAGQALMRGHFALCTGAISTPDQPPWDLEAPREAWAEELNGFSWLRHFNAEGGEQAGSKARELVDSWLKQNGVWNELAWRPHVIARRLISWLSHGRLVMDGAEVVWRSALMVNIAKQARHLSRTVRLAPDGEPRLTAAIGLALSGICLSEGDQRYEQGMALLSNELDRQILPDGGHVSRSPSLQLSILLDLMSLKSAIAARQDVTPPDLQIAIDRMTPMLRFFRLGDGRLALFNGSTEEVNGSSDAVLSRDDIKGKPLGHARHSGYQRVAAGRSILIADAGAPPRGRYSQRMHAGCLSFELSSGVHRLIVNCGDAIDRGDDWRVASRATAAHSTLTLDDTSSAAFLWGEFWTKLLGERLIAGAKTVTNHRAEEDGAIWITASHDGYAPGYGVVHERRLYLDRLGADLRGQDQLIKSGDAPSGTPDEVPFAVRFHLHPDVKASLSRDGGSVLLLLPNGEGWRFRAGGGDVGLEESVYLGKPNAARRTQQIVVSGAADITSDTPADIKWALHKLVAKVKKPPAKERNTTVPKPTNT
jgi:uncharacterized heparinase superfamily protein